MTNVFITRRIGMMVKNMEIDQQVMIYPKVFAWIMIFGLKWISVLSQLNLTQGSSFDNFEVSLLIIC